MNCLPPRDQVERAEVSLRPLLAGAAEEEGSQEELERLVMASRDIVWGAVTMERWRCDFDLGGP